MVRWPTASALSKNPFRLSEKDFRIYSATVLGFSGVLISIVNNSPVV